MTDFLISGYLLNLRQASRDLLKNDETYLGKEKLE